MIDEFTRRALWIECVRHLTSFDVVRVLDQLVELHGKPATIKSDNGPEFVAKKVQEWIEDRHINARFIDPGSPWQNGHNESFNGVFRGGCLNLWLFESVRESREATEHWLYEYNFERPPGSLSGRSPAMFFEQWNNSKGKQLEGQAKSLTKRLVPFSWACHRDVMFATRGADVPNHLCSLQDSDDLLL